MTKNVGFVFWLLLSAYRVDRQFVRKTELSALCVCVYFVQFENFSTECYFIFYCKQAGIKEQIFEIGTRHILCGQIL